MHRIHCKFVPSIRFTPSGGRFNGSWRVAACYEPTSGYGAELSPVRVSQTEPGQVLELWAVRPRQRNAWCNPREILAEWLAWRRHELHRHRVFAEFLANDRRERRASLQAAKSVLLAAGA